MSKTPSSTLNSRIRGKKVEFLSDDDEKLITRALSFVWIKTNKKIKACNFNQEKVKVSYKKNEGRVYFDLDESLSSFTFINKVITLFTYSLCFIFFLNTIFFISEQLCSLSSCISFLFLDNFVYSIFFVSRQLCPLFPCILFLF